MHLYPRILSVTHKFWEQCETENIFVSSETHPLLVRAGGGGGGGGSGGGGGGAELGLQCLFIL